MIRLIITIVTIFCSASSMAQALTFDSAVRRLYFGVDIIKASGSLADSFKSVQQLYYSDTVNQQSNLNLTIELNSDNAWSSRHVFSFRESPIDNLKIKSGHIEVLTGEAPQVKKLLRVEWYVDFDNEKDAAVFFGWLRKTFDPLSTKKKVEFDKNVGEIVQYSTRAPGVTGIKDIALVMGKSFRTKKYKVSLSLLNEFMNE
jgi:hypothetical protein